MEDEQDQYWSRGRSSHHRPIANPIEKEIELLKSLPDTTFEFVAGEVEKYRIEILTNRGYRKVDWWPATGQWKVVFGRGEGKGIYSMGRYFQLIPQAAVQKG